MCMPLLAVEASGAACLGIGAGAVLLLALLVGAVTQKTACGILIDTRGRYSLNHFQLVTWTVLILGTWLGLLLKNDFVGLVTIDASLLGLMGVSLGSGVLSAAVKSTKDAPGSGAAVARAGAQVQALGAAAAVDVKAHFAQIFQEEEGANADTTVSLPKFQNFLFTLVAAAMYVPLAARAVNAGGMPVLDGTIVWLLSISHAGYVGGKIPNKA